MIKKRHHYIPKFYLSGFAVPGKLQQIWVYPKDGKTPFKSSITNVGVEKYIFSAEFEDGKTIEDFLAEKVENPANKVIGKLRKRKPISVNEKRDLAVYLAGMMTRVPAARKRAEKNIPRLNKTLEKSIFSSFQESEYEDVKHFRNIQSVVNSLFSDTESKLITELSLPHFDENLIMILHLMNWVLLSCHPSTTFVTTDNPFCFNEAIGLLDEQGTFVFPVSTTLLLHGAWMPKGTKGFQISHSCLSKKGSASINKLLISHATRYVYHHSENDWISHYIQEVSQWEF